MIYCYSQDKSKNHLGGFISCDNIKTDAEALEAEVLSDLFSMKISGITEDKTDITASLLQRKTELSKKLKRLYTLYSEDADDELISAIDDIKRQISDVTQMIDMEEKRKEAELRVGENRKKLGQTEALWQSMSFAQKRAVLFELIDKIVITYDDVDIYYSENLSLTR